jgi:polygalacturonase
MNQVFRLLKNILAIILFISQATLAANPKTYNVLDFGVVADGHTVNTTAIQKLIDDCSAKGGGTVFFPEGKFVSGTILIKD